MNIPKIPDDPDIRRSWFLRVVLAAALAVTACAPKQTPAPAAPPQPPPGPTAEAQAAAIAAERAARERLESLYTRVDDARLEYESGIELLAAGEEILGEHRIVSASVTLRECIEECSGLEGCDVSRVVTAYESLLSDQNIALKQQAFRIETMVASAEQDIDREPGTSPFVAAVPEVGRTVNLLRGTDLRDVITLNGPVNAAIDDWLTWLRPMLLSAYENYQFLRSNVAPIYEQAGLPEALLFAMIATESGGKVHSFSRAGAAGPLQFMRHTGRKYGLTVEDGFDLRLDPEAATRANVGYLNDQFEAFNDSLEKALAAYNGGENRMNGLHRRYDGASVWDSRVYFALPRETREYVPRILAAAWLFLHPEDYNLEFPTYETDLAVLALKVDTSLGELTICLGQEHNPDGWFRTLRNLNPRLEPADRLEKGHEIRIPALLIPVYEDQCLEGELLAKARVLHEANYPDEPEMIHYTVRRGDTLGRIASRFRCSSVGEIAAINRVRPPRYTIQIGQTLKIPSCR